ncbi:hypothetical protein [Pseudooceanicola nanhaiensis]|uniref:hypothetical protein n=1 Tax=Pseudooceanicola nanhaiensis TaxID=375761 RepID=UPI001CD7335E|nr:hypothetical protein [Pseudooceanicola nanhaiensis]MCA0919522.1 hypothetical protein [Pseudooceanicola nanhaiensis]
MLKHGKKWILATALLGGLAACGDTLGEQAVIGAGVGGAGSAVAGGSLATGALVGAAANVAYCNQYPHRCN